MKIAVIADLHHYARSLGDSGRAFELRQGSDQKCLKETGAIIDAVFDRFIREQPDAVVIAGDISNDGEAASHKEIREKLLRLQAHIPVFLTTATHDWCCDGRARSYKDNEIIPVTDVFTPTQLRESYRVFGEDKILSEYRTHLDKCSYCYALNDRVRILALEDDQDGAGASGYSDEHLAWICEQLEKAKEDKVCIFAFQHHLLLENLVPLVNKSQKIGNNVYRATRLADAGLRLIFVGHSHMQRTSTLTTESGNTVTQVNVGSLCGHPGAINYLTIDDGGNAQITVERVESFVLDGQACDSKYLSEHTWGLVTNILTAARNSCEDLDERLRAMGIRIAPLQKIYPLFRYGTKKLMTVSVGKAAAAVNALTFGKGICRKAVREIADDRLLDYIRAILLFVFDGSRDADKMPTAAKKVAADVASLPGRVLRKVPFKKDKIQKILGITDQIEQLLDELVNPKRNHQLTQVALCDRSFCDESKT